MKKRLFTLICAVLLAAALTVPALAYASDELVGELTYRLTATEADELATCRESTLGSVAADAVRRAAGTDIAIVCGGDLSGDLGMGEVYYHELTAILADAPLGTAAVSVKALRAMLEQSVHRITIGTDEHIIEDESAFAGFAQVSGFTFTYDGSALPGERVTKLLLGEEELELDLEDDSTILTIAGSMALLTGEYGMTPCENVQDMGTTLCTAVADYFRAEGSVGKPSPHRVNIIGTSETLLVDGISPWVFIIGAILFGFANYGMRKYKGVYYGFNMDE